jgi:hypothetical protein
MGGKGDHVLEGFTAGVTRFSDRESRDAQGLARPVTREEESPMTTQKHLKQLVRARMEKTGERYAAAHRQVLARQPVASARGAASVHLSGAITATTALRVLLRHQKQQWSEAELFVAAGGIGAGVFAFLYEKTDEASLYLAGRHQWHDDLGYLKSAASRLGFGTTIKESTNQKLALRQLQEALEPGRPVIAWVDAAHLPHRALPRNWSGGGYHLITIYAFDEKRALIGDMGDTPVEITLEDLAIARSRIRKQKHRLLWLEPNAKPTAKQRAVSEGVAACVTELTTCRMKNYRLDAFGILADRMVGGKNKESWERMFPPGGRLWTALTSLHDFVAHYGTGGGLMRPIFAEGLAATGRAAAAQRYDALGRAWTRLADAALPGSHAATKRARQLLSRKAELTRSHGDPAEIRECFAELKSLSEAARKRFPLSSSQAVELRQQLQQQLRAIHVAEVEALSSLSSLDRLPFSTSPLSPSP